MKKKLTCLLLCVLLAMGQVQAAAPEQVQQPTTQPTAADQQMAEMEAELELSRLPLYDRYIVKLKPTNSLTAAANTTLDAAVEAAIPAAKQAANVQVQAVLDDKQVDETEAFDLAETPAYTVEPQSPELLTVTLTEKVDAAAFTAELSENAQIEYIQPDYTLELASDVVLDLDLSELTPAGTAVPAVTAAPTPEVTSAPEIDLEITPEQTTAPEATLDPEVQPTPETEPTPEPSESPEAAPIVAVIDAGIDVAHHGLTEQILPGYDFVNNTELVYDSSKKDEYYHGTHVAGIIAQNAPTAQILPLKVFEHGRAYTSDIIRAIEYAQEHGASVVNMSFGGADDNRALREAMQERNMLFVCAAGNARTDVEETPVYPACFDLDNIISVASLNQDLGFSYYSNYGTESVDIAAVGRDVYSMWPEGAYGTMSGTSQAAAQVSAGAAEALARGDADAKAAVLERADRYTHLMNKVADGRSLNLFNVAAGVVSEGVQTVEYEDDFDVHGYQPTPEENWELFSSVETVDVAAGWGSSYALRSDGTVWAWGDNQYNALGLGMNVMPGGPTQIPGLTDIISICAEYHNCIALKNDGTIMTWGDDGEVPMSIAGIDSATKIWAAGGFYYQTANGAVMQGLSTSKFTDKSYVKDIYFKDINTTYFIFENGDVYENDEKVDYLSNAKSIVGNYALKNDNIVYDFSTGSCVPVTGLNNIESLSRGSGVNPAIHAIASDGTVYAWGNNNYGQLGDGTKVSKETPTIIPQLSGIVNICTGNQHCIGLDSNNQIYTWGNNTHGQLGSNNGNDFVSRLEPHMIPNFQGVKQVASGVMHSLAVKEDGTVWGWGYNNDNQLSEEVGKPAVSSPVQISGITNAKMVACGYNFSVILKDDGTVWTCGSNSFGELGDGTTTDSGEFKQVTGLNNIISISSGYYHSLALRSDGTVWAWGKNGEGQLGDGTFIDRTAPVQVPIQAVDSISAGIQNSFAVLQNGAVMGWGINSGKLINANLQISDKVKSPFEVLNSAYNVNAISTDGSLLLIKKTDGTVWAKGYCYTGSIGNASYDGTIIFSPKRISHSYSALAESICSFGETGIVYEDGTLWTCGPNVYGNVGDGTRTSRHSPYNVLNNIKQVFISEFFVLAVKEDGTVWAWGDNDNGELGDGRLLESLTPILLGNNVDTPIIQSSTIAAGNGHSLVIGENGTILASGRGTHGQLGNGARTDSTTPVQVKDAAGTGNFTGAKAVAAGFLFSLALKEDGTLWTWGNATGFMTDTDDHHTDLPIRVKDANGQHLEDIIAISAKKEFWLALRSDGTVWSWGRNESGQLGNGTYNNTCFTNAVQVKNADGTPLTDVIAISAGGAHSMAKKADGTIWAWGKNENGQLGNGATENLPNPVQVTGLTDVAEISAGEFHSMVRKTDGTVWAWGRNQYGQLGDNTRNSSNTPVQVKGKNGFGYLTGVEEIAAGIGYSMALLDDGTLMAWGHNNSYQLGDGTQQSKNAPVEVMDATGTGALADVVEFSANNEISMAKTADGTVWIWGMNRYGEFGDGTSGSYSALPLEFGVVGEDPGTSLTLQGSYIVVSAEDMTDPDTRFKLTYDQTKLNLINIAAQKNLSVLTPGTYGRLVVESVADGEIVFGLNLTLENGEKWSGAITVFEAQALTEGETTVSLSVL